MNFKNYIFDFDGTLVDSMPVWTRKVLRVLEKEKIPCPDGFIETVTPLGDRGTAEYMIRELGVKAEVEDIIREMNRFASPEYEQSIPLKEGVAEMLSVLRECDCTLSILSASPHQMLYPCLVRNGILDAFDNVWSCEDFGKAKSDPRLYTDVVKALNASVDEIAFFDDNVNALRAATRCGIFTVGVYDKSSDKLRSEIMHTSGLYLNSFSDLIFSLPRHGG